MKNGKIVSFRDVELKDGFWAKRYALNKTATIASVRAFAEANGRFDALRYNYVKTGKKPHIFYASDAAKWIEAVAYILEKDRGASPENEQIVDELVSAMSLYQRDDGYLNPYFQQFDQERVFVDRHAHELYTTGHLIEAAIAYDKATGKHKFLEIMEKNCDCIYRAFIEDKTAAFVTPGHQEIELALFKLYRYTGNKKYFDMAKFFLENRGKTPEQKIDDNPYGTQDDVDIYNLREANGHCVRALYYYCAIADLYAETGDKRIKAALDSVFNDITNYKMYITGGVGSTARGESFTTKYDLPNRTAYSESCGAIAFILFALRLRETDRNAKYGNLIERVMYNSLLSSTSLDGTAFFYENPLEIAIEEYDREVAVSPERRERLPITQRKVNYSCSCCPPNICRMLAEIGDVICVDEEDALYIEQYIAAQVNTSHGTLTISETYALDGKATISSTNFTGKTLAVRLPEWSKKFEAVLENAKTEPEIRDGYAYFSVGRNFTLALDFFARPAFVAAHPSVRADVGRVALTLGPLVYCLEGVDNGARLNRISVPVSAAESADKEKDFHGLYSVIVDGYRDLDNSRLYYAAEESEKAPVKLKFIPYFAFANRGESDMLVWVRKA